MGDAQVDQGAHGQGQDQREQGPAEDLGPLVARKEHAQGHQQGHVGHDGGDGAGQPQAEHPAGVGHLLPVPAVGDDGELAHEVLPADAGIHKEEHRRGHAQQQGEDDEPGLPQPGIAEEQGGHPRQDKPHPQGDHKGELVGVLVVPLIEAVGALPGLLLGGEVVVGHAEGVLRQLLPHELVQGAGEQVGQGEEGGGLGQGQAGIT